MSIIGNIVGGIFGKKNQKSANSANLRATRETNAANIAIANNANALSQRLVNQAYARDRAGVYDQRRFDVAQVVDARKWDRSQVEDERRYNQRVATAADQRDRGRFLQDRTHSENQQRLAEARDRAAFLENRGFELDQTIAGEDRAQARFLENRGYNEAQALAAEERQRAYAAADLADARAYADPAAERARLEAAGFNPLGRMDSSSGLNSIGGAIANAPASFASVTSGYQGGAQAPAARASEAMGLPGPVPAGVGTAQSQIARSQMAQMGVFDPAVAHMSPPAMQVADNSLGRGIADAFQSYEDAQIQEKEYALRKSQLEVEQTRLSELMQRATMRPIVGGVYGNEVGQGREEYVEAGGASTPRAPRASNGVSGTPGGKAYNDTKEIAVGGYVMGTDKGTSDAQKLTDRYGEIVEAVGGLGILAIDAGKAAGRQLGINTPEKRRDMGAAANDWLKGVRQTGVEYRKQREVETRESKKEKQEYDRQKSREADEKKRRKWKAQYDSFMSNVSGMND